MSTAAAASTTASIIVTTTADVDSENVVIVEWQCRLGFLAGFPCDASLVMNVGTCERIHE